jgi:hypothetical protein
VNKRKRKKEGPIKLAKKSCLDHINNQFFSVFRCNSCSALFLAKANNSGYSPCQLCSGTGGGTGVCVKRDFFVSIDTSTVNKCD